MGTRSTTHFKDELSGKPVAIIYKHWDGYLSEMKEVFAKFFDQVEADTSDHRYTDASYLAAKFVVFLASEYEENGKRINFLSVGVCDSDPGDIAYRYTVVCSHPLPADRRPPVWVQERDYDNSAPLLPKFKGPYRVEIARKEGENASTIQTGSGPV